MSRFHHQDLTNLFIKLLLIKFYSHDRKFLRNLELSEYSIKLSRLLASSSTCFQALETCIAKQHQHFKNTTTCRFKDLLKEYCSSTLTRTCFPFTYYKKNFENKLYLGFPLSAAWWRALNPLLLVIVTSAPASKSTARISSRFLLIASWSGVSPSES